MRDITHKAHEDAASPEQTASPGQATSHTSVPAILQRRLFWRFLKTLLWFFTFLFFLLLLSFGVLQTNVGQNLFAEAVESLLSTPNEHVGVRGLHGQVPFDMHIGHLLLADREGVWLEVEQLHFAWSWIELFRGQIHLEEVTATILRVHRQPRRDPTLQRKSKMGTDTLKPFSHFLFPLFLKRLHLPLIIVDAAVGGKEARFSLNGQVWQEVSGKNEGGQEASATTLRSKLALRPLDTGNTQLTVEGKFAPGSSPKDPAILSLAIMGHERHGLTPLLTGLPQAKEAAFRLVGKGPLTEWKASLSLEVAGLGRFQSQLLLSHALTTPSPSQRDAKEHPTLRLEGTVQLEEGWIGAAWTKLLRSRRTPHQEESQQSAAMALKLGDSAVHFIIQAELADLQKIILSQMELNGHFATVQGQGTLDWHTQTLDAQAELQVPQLAPASPLVGTPLEGDLSASLLAHGHWQRPHLNVATQAKALVVSHLRARQLTATLGGHFPGDPGQPMATMQVTGQGTLLGLHQESGALPLEEQLFWSADVTLPMAGADEAVSHSGTIQVAKLEVKDRNMTVLLHGDVDTKQGRAQGDWQWTLPHLSHLETLAALGGRAFPVPGLQGHGAFSGRFAWNPSFLLNAGRSPWQMTVAGTLLGLQGLPPVAQELLGSSVETTLHVALWPGKKMAITGLDLRGETLQTQGDIHTDFVTGALTSTLQTTLAKLDRLSTGAGVALAGTLEVDTLLSGTYTKPHLRVGLQSDRLKVDRSYFKELHADLLVDDLKGLPHGTCHVTLSHSFGELGEQPVSGTLSYRLQGDALNVSDLHLQWPGGILTGQLKADLEHKVVEGQLRGHSDDPSLLAAWFQAAPQTSMAFSDPEVANEQKPLSGTLDLQALLTGKGQRQGVELDLTAQFVRGAFGFLENAKLKARWDDLFGKERGTVKVTVSKALWGEMQLRSGTLTAVGNQQLAEVSLRAKGMFEVGTLDRPQRTQETFDLEANGKLEMDNKGILRGSLLGLTGNIGQDSLQLEQTAHLVLTPSGNKQAHHAVLDLDRLELRYGPAQLKGHLHYDTEQLDMELDLGLPLGIVARFGAPNLQGTVRFHGKLRGSPRNPVGHFTLQMDQIRIHDPTLEAIPFANIVAEAHLGEGQVKADILLNKTISNPVSAQLLFPMQLGFAPFHFEIPANGELGGRLKAKASLEYFASVAALDTQKLDGLAHIALDFGGTVAAPSVQGSVLLSEGSYENLMLGTVLKDIRLKVTARGDKITMDSFQASDGGDGRLRASGSFLLDPDRHFPFQVDATLDHGVIVQRDELHAMVSGTLAVRGNGEAFKIKGELTSDELSYYFLETSGPDIKTVAIDSEIRNGLDITAKRSPIKENAQIALDLTLRLPNRAFMRGRGLESEWQGDLAVTGALNSPIISGELLVKRGHFEFLDRRFDLRKGIIVFDGSAPPKPDIDLEAESQSAGGIVALLNLKGVLPKPQLKLTSEPELPHDEILSRLLFNRESRQLTPTQAISLVAAVDNLSSAGPGILGKARDEIGFDRLELAGDSIETGSVKAGKYFGNKVFLGIERGLNQGSGKVSIELELTPNITVETEMDENNSSSLGINWKYDY